MLFPFSNQQKSSIIMIETNLEAMLSVVAAWPKKIQIPSVLLSHLSLKTQQRNPAVLSS